jgi:hypothetical protein
MKLTLDAFKDLVKTDQNFSDRIKGASDVIDFDNGSMTIHRGNLDRYLEQYMCKSEDDLSDTMWYSYGVFVKIVD